MRVRLLKRYFGPDQRRHNAGKVIEIEPEHFAKSFMESLDGDEPMKKKKKPGRTKKKEVEAQEEVVEKVETSKEPETTPEYDVI